MTGAAQQTSRGSRRAARAEAAAWIVRLHGPHRSPELEAAFRTWLGAHPENARQFERVTEVWDTAPAVQSGGLARVARWENKRRPAVWALAASVLLVCGLAAAFWFMNGRVYATQVGEQRLVRLEDGSRVSLNSTTRIQIAFDASGRRVHLKHGEALFEVAADPRRPFVVMAGDRQITALGTSFVVRYEPGRTAVTLVEGRVAVAGAGDAPTGAAATLLAPGQRLIFARNHAPAMDTPRIEAVTAWRRGEVMLEKVTLSDAVAEMNRYDATPLIIDDPAIARLRVSGIYHTGDTEGFARTVARLYDLEFVKRADRMYLRPGPDRGR